MKKMIFGLATCGLILSSCSSNDVFEDNQGTNNPNVINFSATTTRATVNNLASVQGGFPVYAVKTENTNKAWHINGRTYKFDGTWKWDGEGAAEQWPNDIANYPMNFYAYYPATHEGYAEHGEVESKVNSPIQGGVNTNSLTSVITIQATAEAQADYLAANTTGIVRPMTTVPLQFKHITTKINFGVIAAEGTRSYVQQMNINNVKNQGTYDYVTTTEKNEVEKYWTIGNYATLEKARYDYWGETGNPGSNTSVITPRQFSGTETNPQPFYNLNSEPDKNKNLMLLPQKGNATENDGGTEVWQKPVSTPGQTISTEGAYIGSVYRMTDGATDPAKEKDLVGYTLAASHPNYATSKHMDAIKPTEHYTGPLFVKVGFPLAASSNDFNWYMGKGYTYNIVLGAFGSSGGIILDDRYYDKYGNPTDMTIDGKNPGDPVLGGDIHFHVTVENWNDQPGTSIEPAPGTGN